jgi:hypothetical protein
MGGGHASDNGQIEWVLGLYTIDAGTGDISANGIKYETGPSYYTSSKGYQFI